ETGPLEVTVSDAVEAPFFVLGQDTNEEWIATLFAGLTPEELAGLMRLLGTTKASIQRAARPANPEDAT
ncbi:MAG TPA: hypothetical protein PKW21_02695, partial [Rhabdaerophilum sp.]|nr:hypothetical protein [Rhabdaerophilum sp.]